MAKELAPSASPEAPKQYTAIDTLAVNNARIHDFINELGKPIKIAFEPGKATEVSEYIAVNFLSKVASFSVFNPSGSQIRWKEAAKDEESEGVVLEADEVIAKLTDLKSDALRRLAKAKGIPFNTRTTDETIISKMTLEEVDEVEPSKVEFENEDGEVVIE